MLSVDVLDVTGQSESDASIAKGMDLRKIRLDANGKRIGRTDYVTPQSQQVVEDASGQSMMNVNVPMAMKVSLPQLWRHWVRHHTGRYAPYPSATTRVILNADPAFSVRMQHLTEMEEEADNNEVDINPILHPGTVQLAPHATHSTQDKHVKSRVGAPRVAQLTGSEQVDATSVAQHSAALHNTKPCAGQPS